MNGRKYTMNKIGVIRVILTKRKKLPVRERLRRDLYYDATLTYFWRAVFIFAIVLFFIYLTTL